ncbi:MAG TPA: glycosyltransferase family 4 protein [Actinomycetota bacterium]|nr:glycosyltransferase family 4 protein [Actinomycetota bacterium]
MARIAYVSPLPPAPTGIASYSAAVLPRLRRTGVGRIDAVWPVDGRAEEAVGRADLAVYHIGNNLDFHRDVYGLAVRHPGLVVLHDLSLDDLGGALLAVNDPLGPPTRAEALATAARLADGPAVDEPLRVPWCAFLARRSRGILVHSEFGRRYLEAFGCRTPAFVVPHPPVETPAAIRRAARRARRLRRRVAPEGVLVGVLGDVGAAKGIEAVVEAVARVGPPARLAIVGRRIPMYDIEEVLARSGHRDLVTVAQDVSDADFLAWLAACDVVVNLRHPHRGEVSGTLLRAFQAGVPAVVSATGTYLDWPEGAVVRVPPGPPDADTLAPVLDGLVRDPARRAEIGRRGHALADRLAAEDATARGYRRAIDATVALATDPARGALARWADALADVGATPETAARGLGVDYADALDELRS